ncbi:S-layer homology domain-containing protein [Cohnella faecalis]|uniref:S-layer homology domain-containing protein n=1 Tax=Cohnella faecalis TaxID=2315694 RepID=UPI0011C22A58|nr:S-layer homology domain-containing protein [Cohnella faecalis]
MSGELSLLGVTDFYYNTISSQATLKDQGGNIVQEQQKIGRFWNSLTIPLDSPLQAGTYTLEFSVNYPGLAEPFQVNREVIVHSMDNNEIKGLVVEAEDESGEPLQNGHVMLFEKQLPNWSWFYSGYASNRTYDAGSIGDGKFFIPNAFLLAGKQYEVVVYGKSSDGMTDVFYNQPVSSGQANVKFTASSLKKLTFEASQAQAGQEVRVSLQNSDGLLVAWPFPVSFGADRKASMYIHTDNNLLVNSNLYDEAADTAYYLEKAYSLSSSATQTVNLAGPLVSITPPSGYDSAKLSINEGMPASKYYATQGISATVLYSLEKNGTSYTLSKLFSNLAKNERLSFDKNFSPRNSAQSFQNSANASVVNSDYYDNKDNYLYEVSSGPGSQFNGLNQTARFQVQTNEGSKKMLARRSGQDVVYQLVDNSTEGTLNLLEYQLYDGSTRAVGSKVYSNSLRSIQMNMPSVDGNYSLNLIKQNFPNDVVKLSGSIPISVVSNFKISISLPSGYELNPFGWNQSVEIWSKDGERENQYPAFIDIDGNLGILSFDSFQPNTEYEINFALSLRKIGSSFEEVSMYYNRIKLKGSQLKKLVRIAVPNDVVTIQPTYSSPVSSDALAQYNMAISGYEKAFSFYVEGEKADAGWEFPPVILSPRQFDVVVTGVDGVKAFSSLKTVNVSSDGRDVTVTDKPSYSVRLKDNSPFLNFYTFYEGTRSSGIAGYNYSDKLMLNQAFVSMGKQNLQFETVDIAPNETPWVNSWTTSVPKDVQSDTVIDFDGKINASASSLDVVILDDLIFKLKPNLISGDLKLQGVQVLLDRFVSPNFSQSAFAQNAEVQQTVAYEGSFSSPRQVPAVVSISDAAGKVVYESQTNQWQDGVYIFHKLAPGTYTFTFRVPVGPNEEAKVSKAFTVKSADNGTGGTGGTGGNGDGGVGGGEAIPGGTVDPATEPNNQVTEFKKDDIPAAANGTVTLDAKGKEEVVLPLSAVETIGTSRLQVRTANSEVAIPPQVLEQLSKLAAGKELEGAKISFKVQPVDLKAALPTDGNVSITGPVYEFQLSVSMADGTTRKLTQFDAPILLTFEVEPGAANRSITGVYYIDDNGKLEYVGGKWDGNRIVAEVRHFSKFGALTYDKRFSDVSDKHWAYNVIRQMVAKQIVTGVSEVSFAPERKITRAEFASMLANALQLKAERSAAFADVPSNAWYLGAISAAFEKGILRGVGNNRFAPNKEITREEMAVMVVNAIRLSERKESSGQNPTFKDSDEVSAWAQDAVNSAYRNGVMNGRGLNSFAPKQQATRAEAVQVIYNLLNVK